MNSLPLRLSKRALEYPWSSSSASRSLSRATASRWHSYSTQCGRRGREALTAPTLSRTRPNLQNTLCSNYLLSVNYQHMKLPSRAASSSSPSTPTNNRTPPPSTARNTAASPSTSSSIAQQPPSPTSQTTDNIFKSGLADTPPGPNLENGNGTGTTEQVDWTRSFHGISSERFPKESADILLAPVDPAEVEVKPDGILYLPEIKYRRILNKAFGPGGWGLVPRSESIVTPKTVTREYALVCNGR
jgi:hypothetical protein